MAIAPVALVLAAFSAHGAPSSQRQAAAGKVHAPKTYRVLYAPSPVYPYVARLQRWEGKGLFVLYLRADGTVSAVGVVRSTGFKVLDVAGATAFIKWRFPPQSVSRVKIPLRFELQPATRFW